MISMQIWATHNGCSSNPIVSAVTRGDGTTASLFYQFLECDSEIIVEHYAISDGHHFTGGAIVNGSPISYEISFDCIKRVEAGGTSATPTAPSSSTGGTSATPTAPSSSTGVPKFAPANVGVVCFDDPNLE